MYSIKNKFRIYKEYCYVIFLIMGSFGFKNGRWGEWEKGWKMDNESKNLKI